MRITFAVDHVTAGGRHYKAGSTHEVNDNDARALVHRGLARPEDSAPAPADADTSATAGTTEE